MKTRSQFISNSSSSSFIIEKYWLDENQIEKIRDHKEWAPIIQERINSDSLFKLVCGSPRLDEWSFKTNNGNAWRVQENDLYIFLDTCLDNFDMEEYLKVIHAFDNVVERSDIDDEDSLKIAKELQWG